MKGKKVIHWGGTWGNGGTVQIASWKCYFSIYLDIQAITTLLCLPLFFYVLVPSIYSITNVMDHSKIYTFIFPCKF